ncbi:unnamed protein product [Ambrosiozyma monospora]|uniref:Unnamed protein product n=1 Tax=Ambrosiozyma monospora TaxID=43982 RepID=A0ACB5T0E4_AMBMO|nr:unnamed protein product [Ambrosiozyma monospora]
MERKRISDDDNENENTNDEEDDPASLATITGLKQTSKGQSQTKTSNKPRQRQSHPKQPRIIHPSSPLMVPQSGGNTFFSTNLSIQGSNSVLQTSSQIGATLGSIFGSDIDSNPNTNPNLTAKRIPHPTVLQPSSALRKTRPSQSQSQQQQPPQSATSVVVPPSAPYLSTTAVTGSSTNDSFITAREVRFTPGSIPLVETQYDLDSGRKIGTNDNFRRHSLQQITPLTMRSSHHSKKGVGVAFTEGTKLSGNGGVGQRRNSLLSRIPSTSKKRLTLKKAEPIPIDLNAEGEQPLILDRRENSHVKLMTREAIEAYETWRQKKAVAKMQRKFDSERLKLDKFLKNFQAGDIILLERMLVLVTSVDDVQPVLDQFAYPRVIEKWKEYIVVARSTGRRDAPVVLQFFSKRKIMFHDHEEEHHDSSDEEFSTLDKDAAADPDDDTKLKSYINSRPKDYEFKLYMIQGQTVVGLNNTLDKSFYISRLNYKKKKQMRYILLGQTMEVALRWITFLLGVLHQKAYNERLVLHVNIPDLDISLTFRNTFTELSRDDFRSDDHITLHYLRQGYKYPQMTGFEKIMDKMLLEINKLPPYIVKDDAKARNFLRKLRMERHTLAFAFRQYDKLEWVLGGHESLLQAIWPIATDSHDLELRELTHESHVTPDGFLKEPLPIEGFLVRLSNREGKISSKLGSNYYKMQYFFTCDNLLLFQEFYHAVPPFEQHMRHLISPVGDVFDKQEVEKLSLNRPEKFIKSTFPLTKSFHIQWLHPEITPEQFEEYDAEVLYETERRIGLVANSRGVIDLLEVTEILPVPISKIAPMIKVAGALSWDWSKEVAESMESYFEIKFRNGTSLRIQASSEDIRDEWIKRLLEHSDYWTKKKASDMAEVMQLREENMKANNISNDTYESYVAVEQRYHKWENSNAKPNPLFYNVSSFSVNKPIIMSGILYRKRTKHKSFSQSFAALTPGFLILYQSIKRSKVSGVDKATNYYKRYAILSLKNCYVYCFPMNDLDLLENESGFNQTQPGGYALPRIYSDGWRSSEDQNTRYFTLWFGSKRVMLRSLSKVKKQNDSDSDSSSDRKKLEKEIY